MNQLKAGCKRPKEQKDRVKKFEFTLKLTEDWKGAALVWAASFFVEERSWTSTSKASPATGLFGVPPGKLGKTTARNIKFVVKE
jgi:hypothetical protein